MIGAAGVGLFALGSWASNHGLFATFDSEYVPMAPSTAFLFVLLGLALGAGHHWPDGRPVRVFGVVTAFITMVVSALVVAQAWSYFPLPWDNWLTQPDLRLGAIPLGRMSPLAAATFMLSAVILLVRALRHPIPRWLRQSTLVSAGAARTAPRNSSARSMHCATAWANRSATRARRPTAPPREPTRQLGRPSHETRGPAEVFAQTRKTSALTPRNNHHENHLAHG